MEKTGNLPKGVAEKMAASQERVTGLGADFHDPHGKSEPSRVHTGGEKVSDQPRKKKRGGTNKRLRVGPKNPECTTQKNVISPGRNRATTAEKRSGRRSPMQKRTRRLDFIGKKFEEFGTERKKKGNREKELTSKTGPSQTAKRKGDKRGEHENGA